MSLVLTWVRAVVVVFVKIGAWGHVSSVANLLPENHCLMGAISCGVKMIGRINGSYGCQGESSHLVLAIAAAPLLARLMLLERVDG